MNYPTRAGAIAALLLLNACGSVPITGRNQLNLLPESDLMGMSLTEYQGFLKENPPLPAGDQRVAMVRGIGQRLAKASADYLAGVGASSRIDGFNWEFNVVNDPTVNAWCMPGGKVVVYTGILPVTQDEAGLAVVMGHEIAHAIARHGNERMSQGMLAQGVGLALSVALSEKPQWTHDLFLQSYGIGTQLGMLAYSRSHESEADKMGLVFMAMAGYDPRTAPKFWERMSAQSGGGKPPELLSTHPSDATRIRDLEAYMPEAMKHYKP
ncbi:MAG: M48 family metallopeptidase [Flavobacteriales bacterium]|nr:M48 family metallopeptidase [Flavobacteriales bacterium]MBK6754737.1 M48 family metallopeptidase [Flavobacteriales bacterium]MBK7086196.1 M48 family metallopeptidase [Flavobacteriales bacterium]MBK7271255.1 M48 family metallopeptidase [Flavobacteriales bacterium]MBK7754223.1 M48 family metallopeptidase [Flavobacteriales bacterium]